MSKATETDGREGAPAPEGPAPKKAGAAASPSAPAPPEAADQAASGDAGPDGQSEGTGGAHVADGAPDGQEAHVADGAPDDGSADGSASSSDEAAEHGTQVKDDLDELVAVAAQRDEYLALAQRTQADFENYRKRMAREVGAAEGRGLTRLTRELLPALDNLQRALDAAEANGGAGEDGLARGIRLVQSELMAALGRVGIESYSPAGETFDPQCHEAMAQQPSDGAESGTVIEVYQPGYRLGETIIRPARVVVAA